VSELVEIWGREGREAEKSAGCVCESLHYGACVSIRVCARVCMCAHVRVCVRACVRESERVSPCVCVCVRARYRAWIVVIYD